MVDMTRWSAMRSRHSPLEWGVLLAPLASLLLGGCGECAASLILQIRDESSTPGGAYYRTTRPDGVCEGVGFSYMAPPVGTISEVGTECYGSPHSADEPGWVLEAWIDPDGDDLEACNPLRMPGSPGSCDDPACGPEPGEPQGRAEYTISARGATRVLVVLADP